MKLILLLLIFGFTCSLPRTVLSQIEPPTEKPPQLRFDAIKRPSKNPQERVPDEEAKKFADSVKERNMDQLFEAISEFDRGNFNSIVRIGMSSTPLGRSNIVFKQVLFDVRVIKLREFLSALPKEEAAKRVKQEFSKKFEAFQNLVAKHFEFWDRDSGSFSFDLPPASHGLSATLYLSSEFCDHDTFRQQYGKWLNWYRVERTKRFVALHAMKEKLSANLITLEDHSRLWSSAVEFESEGVPDRLFFINLCGVRAMRRGVEFETLANWLLELNEETEIKLPKYQLIEMKRFDPVKNQPRPEGIKFPIIYDYGDAVTLCDSFVEWNSQTGKINKQLQDRNDQVSELAIEWSQPNLIRKAIRESRKALLKWSSETYGWPELKGQ